MTRLTAAVIAAGVLTLGIVAGVVLHGALPPSGHDQLMTDHMAAMGAMPMMDMASMHMSSMPMPNMGTMPMASGAVPMPDHQMHHASPAAGR